MSNLLGAITEPPNDHMVNGSFGNLVGDTSTLHIVQQPSDSGHFGLAGVQHGLCGTRSARRGVDSFTSTVNPAQRGFYPLGRKRDLADASARSVKYRVADGCGRNG